MFGLAAIVVYAASLSSASVFAVAFLVAGAAFLAGSLLGFLFGIPRLLAGDGTSAPATGDGTAAGDTAGRRSPYQSNTNLEQISDWLTKILVGVGLVELGRLSSGTKQLVDFLAPALGGQESSPGFAFALLLLYAVSGFLIVYLLTRVYLGRVFAHADDLMQRIDRVEEKQRQQRSDLEALTKATRFLDDPDDPAITQEKLEEAVKVASDLVRVQIFNLARQRRQNGTSDQKKRTPGVFRALIASDTSGTWHRNHGQLGYALYDIDRDYSGAVEALSTAIERRDRDRRGGFHLYDFVRALSRIQLDPKQNTSELSDPEVSEPILTDLRRAYEDPWTRKKILDTRGISWSWMTRNQLAEADLKSTPPAGPGP